MEQKSKAVNKTCPVQVLLSKVLDLVYCIPTPVQMFAKRFLVIWVTSLQQFFYKGEAFIQFSAVTSSREH